MSATEIGRRLKKARLDAGLTQKDVATKLGITYQAISNYERGINRVDTDTLTRLCQIYGIQIFDLLRTPAWDSDMFAAYKDAKSDDERQHLIELWGCPAELIEAENERREPDLSPLSPEDEYILHAYHHGKLSLSTPHANDSKPSNKNTIRIAGRDGSYREETLSDKEYAALIAFLDLLPDVPDGL